MKPVTSAAQLIKIQAEIKEARIDRMGIKDFMSKVVDIPSFMAAEVSVCSHWHSGPVDVALYGVVIDDLLGKIDKSLIEEHLRRRKET